MLTSQPEPEDSELLRRTYEAFNAGDVEAVLTLMHSDVDWPNAIEGGRVHGRDAVRAYWADQFAEGSIRASSRFASRPAVVGGLPSTCTKSSARSTAARSPMHAWSTCTRSAMASFQCMNIEEAEGP
jgi:ketosteroid isomerase-like protein